VVDLRQSPANPAPHSGGATQRKPGGEICVQTRSVCYHRGFFRRQPGIGKPGLVADDGSK